MDVTAALLAVAVTAGALVPAEPVSVPPAAVVVSASAALADVTPEADRFTLRRAPTEALSRRPSALVPLYTSLAVLQGFDIYSTSAALSRGAVEANPAMRPVAGKTWASAAVKAGATAASVYFIERAWKQNRKGAVILATAINVATAAVVAHNTQVSQRR